ncbi:SUN domain-containing protein 1 [Chionoecetes opilio]|uniref:SUN domain-containing protein 1 n=1 Tax=Chionoecetes opilio TaxID=41210 RepID=A0A8J4XWN6_CHIOP|nr:SUN domain-containing protein 1 [Chionoecetes opilio]
MSSRHQARSDYTYSTSLTYRDRVTPDRRIGSPNMARRGLRGGNTSYIKSPDFSSSDLSNETDDSIHLNLRTRTILRPMDALSDTSDGEGEGAMQPVSRRTRSSRSRSCEVVPRSNGSTLTRTVTSYTTTRTLHHGLDVDSDMEDGTVPQRATPFTARSGTPLARAATPANRPNSRSSVSGDGVGRGYTLAKGAIAEDVEEEEEAEAENDSILSWRILSWRSVKRITTYVTTSVVMMAVRTVMAQHLDTSVSASSASEKVSRYSLLSSVSSTSRKVVGAGAGLLAASRDHMRKRPILLWIPLIPLLVLLALVASWWLLQSGAKTGDSADPTQTTAGPSFFAYTLTSASEIIDLVVNGVCYGPILMWQAMLGLGGWVVSVCSVCLSALWAGITSMVLWLGSVAHSGLAYILQTVYLILELLQIMALAVASFFSSSFSYVFGFLLPTNGSEEVAENEAQSWRASAWYSNAASFSWVSQAYTGISEAAQRTQAWLWDGWLWLVICVADAITAGVSSFLWLLGSIWSLLWLLISGLWTVLVYIFTGITGLLSSAATTTTSLVVEVFSTVAGASKLVLLPLFKASESSREQHTTLVTSHATPAHDPEVIVAGLSIEDIVSRVVESTELRALVTSVPPHNTAQSQAITKEIDLLVKSLVEGELRGHKAEAAALWASHAKAAALEAETQVLFVKEQQQDFLTQLELLGADVARLQGSLKANQEGEEQHRHHFETLHSQIDKLALQLRELQINHTSLASEVKSCCKNTTVTLVDVERHVTTLLGDILGLSSGQGGAAGGSWSVADMGAWLRSYFVAKEELERRLSTLTASLQKKSIEDSDIKESSMAANNAAIAQSTQVIMDTVLEKLRAEIQGQYEHRTEAAHQQVSQEVNTQMQAAAVVLGKQVSEQVEHRLQLSKQQLQNSVSVAVEEAVPKYLASSVPEAVASAVSEAVADSVPSAVSAAVPSIVKVAVLSAVETAVNAAVEVAVPEAVATAVPDAVNIAVPGVVNKAVANAVPEVIEEALPKTVNAVVQEAVAAEMHGAITVAVSEVIASVLPSAVSTAVNETVASRISEAIVDAKLTRARDGHIKEMSGEGMVVVSGSHSDLSSSNGATFSATVNVSKQGNKASNLFAPVSIPMSGGLNESAVIRIVKEALMKYDADKTGMVDHALESAGGNIISTRCTESYQVQLAELSILGFAFFRYPTNNNPRIIIQPERMPGQCWAFKGSQGYIVIKLAGFVLPTGFTIEHIPKSLSPSGEIDSAPREFEVWGLHSENDEGIHLGNYEYDQNGDPFQFFAVKKANVEYFPLIELKINSNHGNLHYTCLYRFRVHGLRQKIDLAGVRAVLMGYEAGFGSVLNGLRVPRARYTLGTTALTPLGGYEGLTVYFPLFTSGSPWPMMKN